MNTFEFRGKILIINLSPLVSARLQFRLIASEGGKDGTEALLRPVNILLAHRIAVGCAHRLQLLRAVGVAGADGAAAGAERVRVDRREGQAVGVGGRHGDGGGRGGGGLQVALLI